MGKAGALDHFSHSLVVVGHTMGQSAHLSRLPQCPHLQNESLKSLPCDTAVRAECTNVLARVWHRLAQQRLQGSWTGAKQQ